MYQVLCTMVWNDDVHDVESWTRGMCKTSHLWQHINPGMNISGNPGKHRAGMYRWQIDGGENSNRGKPFTTAVMTCLGLKSTKMRDCPWGILNRSDRVRSIKKQSMEFGTLLREHISMIVWRNNLNRALRQNSFHFRYYKFPSLEHTSLPTQLINYYHK